MFFFYDILKGNKRLSTKTKRSNSRKIEIFLKGLVHGFGQKLAIFPTFFSRQYCPPFAIFNLCRPPSSTLGNGREKTFSKPKNSLK